MCLLQSVVQNHVDVRKSCLKITLVLWDFFYWADLLVLNSSKCSWEEIFPCWRRVGFLGGRISSFSTWRLLRPMQMLTRVWICKTSPAKEAVFHMERNKGTKQLSCWMAAEAVEQVGLMEVPLRLMHQIELSITALPNPHCVLKYSENFHFFFFFSQFVLPSNRLFSHSQLQRRCWPLVTFSRGKV